MTKIHIYYDMLRVTIDYAIFLSPIFKTPRVNCVIVQLSLFNCGLFTEYVNF